VERTGLVKNRGVPEKGKIRKKGPPRKKNLEEKKRSFHAGRSPEPAKAFLKKGKKKTKSKLSGKKEPKPKGGTEHTSVWGPIGEEGKTMKIERKGDKSSKRVRPKNIRKGDQKKAPNEDMC